MHTTWMHTHAHTYRLTHTCTCAHANTHNGWRKDVTSQCLECGTHYDCTLPGRTNAGEVACRRLRDLRTKGFSGAGTVKTSTTTLSLYSSRKSFVTWRVTKTAQPWRERPATVKDQLQLPAKTMSMILKMKLRFFFFCHPDIMTLVDWA